ncbi:amidoligase family protein [Limibacillus sp. MBR-115]|jgi:hypothetical protein|uniref:amidoligase family protein n=1 Tax=Limibacillus sp. MBR-115 TaxID=3156465 RepID=UPI00339423DB
MAESYKRPPLEKTPDGKIRRVGIEIEFSDVDLEASGKIVQRLFGGRLTHSDPHRFKVLDTQFGDFLVELDFTIIHLEDRPEQSELSPLLQEIEAELAKTAGDIAALWLPREIACPPIPFDKLDRLETLVTELRKAGATGTTGRWFAAYGMQINAELARHDVAYLLQHLRAYLLLSAWLRQKIDVNLKRRLTPFIDPFSNAYISKVIDPDYAPDLGGLMDDYMEANPTRSRELDLLPIFGHFDPERVKRRLPNVKVRSRPAFHYRLPDSKVDNPEWNLAREWNFWLEVERLAMDSDRLAKLQTAYIDHHDQILSFGWAEKVDEILSGL